MELYIVTYRYHKEGDKAPGPRQMFRLYATSSSEAEGEARRHANYRGIEIISVHKAPP